MEVVEGEAGHVVADGGGVREADLLQQPLGGFAGAGDEIEAEAVSRERRKLRGLFGAQMGGVEDGGNLVVVKRGASVEAPMEGEGACEIWLDDDNGTLCGVGRDLVDDKGGVVVAAVVLLKL